MSGENTTAFNISVRTWICRLSVIYYHNAVSLAMSEIEGEARVDRRQADMHSNALSATLDRMADTVQ